MGVVYSMETEQVYNAPAARGEQGNEFVELVRALADVVGQQHFGAFVHSTGRYSDCFAWAEVQHFKAIVSTDYRRCKAKQVYNAYMSTSALMLLPELNGRVVKRFERLVNAADGRRLTRNMFSAVEFLAFCRMATIYAQFKRSQWYKPYRLAFNIPHPQVEPAAFALIGVVGRCEHGIVLMAQKRTSRVMFAMKLQSKASLLEAEGTGRGANLSLPFRLHIDALRACEFTCMSALQYAFETERFYVRVSEIASGGTLRDRIDAARWPRVGSTYVASSAGARPEYIPPDFDDGDPSGLVLADDEEGGDAEAEAEAVEAEAEAAAAAAANTKKKKKKRKSSERDGDDDDAEGDDSGALKGPSLTKEQKAQQAQMTEYAKIHNGAALGAMAGEHQILLASLNATWGSMCADLRHNHLRNIGALRLYDAPIATARFDVWSHPASWAFARALGATDHRSLPAVTLIANPAELAPPREISVALTNVSIAPKAEARSMFGRGAHIAPLDATRFHPRCKLIIRADARRRLLTPSGCEVHHAPSRDASLTPDWSDEHFIWTVRDSAFREEDSVSLSIEMDSKKRHSAHPLGVVAVEVPLFLPRGMRSKTHVFEVELMLEEDKRRPGSAERSRRRQANRDNFHAKGGQHGATRGEADSGAPRRERRKSRTHSHSPERRESGGERGVSREAIENAPIGVIAVPGAENLLGQQGRLARRKSKTHREREEPVEWPQTTVTMRVAVTVSSGWRITPRLVPPLAPLVGGGKVDGDVGGGSEEVGETSEKRHEKMKRRKKKKKKSDAEGGAEASGEESDAIAPIPLQAVDPPPAVVEGEGSDGVAAGGVGAGAVPPTKPLADADAEAEAKEEEVLVLTHVGETATRIDPAEEAKATPSAMLPTLLSPEGDAIETRVAIRYRGPRGDPLALVHWVKQHMRCLTLRGARRFALNGEGGGAAARSLRRFVRRHKRCLLLLADPTLPSSTAFEIELAGLFTPLEYIEGGDDEESPALPLAIIDTPFSKDIANLDCFNILNVKRSFIRFAQSERALLLVEDAANQIVNGQKTLTPFRGAPLATAVGNWLGVKLVGIPRRPEFTELAGSALKNAMAADADPFSMRLEAANALYVAPESVDDEDDEGEGEGEEGAEAESPSFGAYGDAEASAGEEDDEGAAGGGKKKSKKKKQKKKRSKSSDAEGGDAGGGAAADAEERSAAGGESSSSKRKKKKKSKTGDDGERGSKKAKKNPFNLAAGRLAPELEEATPLQEGERVVYGGVPENEVRLYAAELVVTMVHLHELGLGFDDLRAENILLDAEGHCQLADTSHLRKLPPRRFGEKKARFDAIRPFTPRPFTPKSNGDAMPPLPPSEEDGKASDWKAMAGLVYELLCGSPPDALLKKPSALQFPHHVSSAAKQLVRGMYCGGWTAKKIRISAFFKGIEWLKVRRWVAVHARGVEARRATAPLTPLRSASLSCSAASVLHPAPPFRFIQVTECGPYKPAWLPPNSSLAKYRVPGRAEVFSRLPMAHGAIFVVPSIADVERVAAENKVKKTQHEKLVAVAVAPKKAPAHELKEASSALTSFAESFGLAATETRGGALVDAASRGAGGTAESSALVVATKDGTKEGDASASALVPVGGGDGAAAAGASESASTALIVAPSTGGALVEAAPKPSLHEHKRVLPETASEWLKHHRARLQERPLEHELGLSEWMPMLRLGYRRTVPNIEGSWAPRLQTSARLDDFVSPVALTAELRLTAPLAAFREVQRAHTKVKLAEAEERRLNQPWARRVLKLEPLPTPVVVEPEIDVEADLDLEVVP